MVVSRQFHDRHVLSLLDKGVLICNVPAERLTKGQQEPWVVYTSYEACGIRVEVGPLVSEKVTQLIIHELIILFWNFLEGLKDNGDEKLHKNHAYYNNVAVEEDSRRYLVTTANSLV